jgi:ligand-binding sensor domain-containing protein
LIRYDGTVFTSFSAPRRLDLSSAYLDREDNLWIGTARGVGKYEGLNTAFLTMEDGLAHSEVHAILQDRDGAFWFGTREGVTRLRGRDTVTFT